MYCLNAMVDHEQIYFPAGTLRMQYKMFSEGEEIGEGNTIADELVRKRSEKH